MRAAVFVLLAILSLSRIAVAGAISTQTAACAKLKDRAGVAIDQSIAGAVSEWRCGFAEKYVPRKFYVVALRAACHDPQGCGSTLLGWYGVRKSNGQVVEWDIDENRPGKPLAASQ